jgi:curved DNA-binding protein CbpA
VTSLYDRLGVSRGATSNEIKTAYRYLARRTHPDAGGAAADFQDIADAYAVLGDADRRARYDEGGDTTSVTEDSQRTEALNVVQAMMEQVLNQVGDGPICNDVVAKMRGAAAEAVTKIEADIEGMRLSVVRFAKFANRFSVKDGETNILRGMVDFKISGLERRIADASRALDRHRMAAEILEDYSFEADPEPVMVQGWAQQGQFGLGGTWPR